jgi:nucleoside-diphosphate-sugar epimerase
MDKLIITGYTGFVGQNLISYLENKTDWEVENLSLRKPIPRSIKSKALIHLAGKAHALKNPGNLQEYIDTNTNLTKKLFDSFLENEIQDFVYMSSVKAVADTIDEPLHETTAPTPQTPYGQSKLQAETYLTSRLLPVGKRLFILRPCMIHGPGNKGNLNLLYSLVKKGIPYPLAAFHNKRSFLSIGNLNYIIERILSNTNVPGGIYNVADDLPLSTNEVIKIIAEAIGCKSKLWSVNPSMINIIATLGDKLKLPLNTERFKKLTESYVVSNEKIKQALNLEHLPVSSKDGLLKTIKSFHIS